MRPVFFTLIIVLAAAPASAQYRVGDTVVAINFVQPRVDNRPVDVVCIGFTLDVLAVEGDKLWVESMAPGWLDAKDVVPLDRAAEHFTKAIAREPLDENLYQARAKVYIATRQFDAAIEDLNEALILVPGWPGFYVDRSNAYLGKRDYDRALEDISKSIEYDPDNAVGYNCRGVVLLLRGDYAGAIEQYEEAHRLNAQYVGPLANLAQVLACCPEAARRDGAKAIEFAKAACEQSQWRNPASLHYLACACAEQGDYAEAARWEEKAIEMTPPTKPQHQKIMRAALTGFQAGQPYHELTRFE